MTVAVMVKVYDGLVLAADSATTMQLEGGGAQVYNSANKVFHLHRRKPIGAMTWGLASIGGASIATLAKDLRRRLMGCDPDHADWELANDYTVEGVAQRLIDLLYDELYQPQYVGVEEPPVLGFLVAGYSGQAQQAEAWYIQFDSASERPVATLEAGQQNSGWSAYAQDEALRRLFMGYDPVLPAVLREVMESSDADAIIAACNDYLLKRPAQPAMPFGDAVALARFMVDVTAGYSRYLLGADTVGGPVEVAGITRHEGFKWISRKHYYPADLNPEDPHHDY